jgi:hypothetical protein
MPCERAFRWRVYSGLTDSVQPLAMQGDLAAAARTWLAAHECSV